MVVCWQHSHVAKMTFQFKHGFLIAPVCLSLPLSPCPDMASQGRNPEMARTLLNEMRELGHAPTRFCWNAVINVHARTGDTEGNCGSNYGYGVGFIRSIAVIFGQSDGVAHPARYIFDANRTHWRYTSCPREKKSPSKAVRTRDLPL